MFFFDFFRSRKPSNTPSASKYDDYDIEVRVANNKIKFKALEYRSQICPVFVDIVYNIVAANKTVIVYAHYEENIFLDGYGGKGIAIRTGQARKGVFYAQFETVDEDFFEDLRSHWLNNMSCLWFRFLPAGTNIEQALASEQHDRVVHNWCVLNAVEESIAKIDNDDEKFGLISDAAILVWTNPQLDLLDTIRKEAAENGFRLVDRD